VAFWGIEGDSEYMGNECQMAQKGAFSVKRGAIIYMTEGNIYYGGII